MLLNNFPRMHVSLYVSDIAQTVAFYSVFFDQQPEKIKEGYAKFILDSPSLIISFVENKQKVASSFGHLGFQLETKEEVEHLLERAKKKNLLFKEEMGTACCFALQDKFWSKDPDGYLWEVYYFHQDVAFNDPRYETGEDEVCCIATTSTTSTGSVTEVTAEAEALEASESPNQCTPGGGCC